MTHREAKLHCTLRQHFRLYFVQVDTVIHPTAFYSNTMQKSFSN